MPRRGAAPHGAQQPAQPPAGHDALLSRVRSLPRRRTYLLPALLALQDDLGWLPGWAIEAAGAHLRVPRSEAYGVASSFPELRLTPPAEHVLRVCTGVACRLSGADALRAALAATLEHVEEADCLYVCGVSPVVELDGRLIGRATLERLRA